MRVGETLYYLQTRSPAEVRAARPLPEDVRLEAQDDLDVVREVTLRIGKPYDWPSQHWDEQAWSGYLGQHDIRHWTVHGVDGVIGLASLRFGQDEVELDTFGLVPEQIGRGLGGPVLAAVMRLAWREAPGAQRLWLHTSSADHPHALENYLRRGFQLYKTEGG